ncbi:MAG: hypothetical protein HYY77_17805 [Betaproteobacteria bacterium]|nr:hypothetical protein [Betaproteobacteria bacterium]
MSARRNGALHVRIDPQQASRYVSARLMLPFVMLPVLGGGVALALIGWVWTGLAVIALGIVLPRLIKRSAPHFLLTQALQDENLYRELIAAGVLDISV